MTSHIYHVYNFHAFIHIVPLDCRDPPSLPVYTSPVHLSRVISDIPLDIPLDNKKSSLNYQAGICALPLFAHSTLLHTIKLMLFNIICLHVLLHPYD